MAPTNKTPFAKKIDGLFRENGWKNSQLNPGVCESIVQRIRTQNYLPEEKTVGKIAVALKKQGSSVEYKELIKLWHQQKSDFQLNQSVLSSSNNWGDYLKRVPEVETALSRYLERYTIRYGQVKLLGMSKPVMLQDIYTDAQTVDPSFLHKWNTLNNLEQEFRESSSRIFVNGKVPRKDGLELANNTQFLNVLGQPGAGKSTFLRKIGLEALLPVEKRKYQHDCIPFFVELKRFKEQPLRLAEIIRREAYSFGFPDGFSDFALKEGKLLLLLDGLDEVPTDRLEQVIQDIRDFIVDHSTNRFITACRTAFYRTWFEQFTDVALADFDDVQIDTFLNNWFCSAHEREIGTVREFSSMLFSFENAATLELGRRPLLLTFICLFYDDTLALPANRCALYHGALRILLERWAAEKRVAKDPIAREINVQWEMILLEQIAGNAFENDKLFFTKKALVTEISQFLKADLNAPDVDGEKLLEMIEVQQGLLVARAHEIYSFSHLTLQEYLASQFFINSGMVPNVIAEHFFDPRWREVFLLLVGSGRADSILQQMANAVTKRISDNKIIGSLLAWVERSYKPSQFDERAEGRSAARRAIAFYFARSFNSKHTYASGALGFARELDFQLSEDDSLGWYFSQFADKPHINYNRDFARDLINKIRKSHVIKDHLLDSACKSIESLKFELITPKRKKAGVTYLPYDKPVISGSKIKDAVLAGFNLPVEAFDWSEKEVKAMDDYFEGCRLLLECKAAAVSVSPDVWKGIVNNLVRST